MLLASLAAVNASAQMHWAGQKIEEVNGCQLWFEQPHGGGSAAGEYYLVNTTGRNMFVTLSDGQTLQIQGHNNADPSDQTDVVRGKIYGTRYAIRIANVAFQHW